MVFLREGGKDELSILLEKGRLEQPANNATTHVGRTVCTQRPQCHCSTGGLMQGSLRFQDATSLPNVTQKAFSRSPSRGVDKGKRKADSLEPTESLLHRLAGPSTNKAGLKRE